MYNLKNNLSTRQKKPKQLAGSPDVTLNKKCPF